MSGGVPAKSQRRDAEKQRKRGELLSRGELARRIAGMGRAWLGPNVDVVADLIKERAGDDEVEGLES